RVITNYLTRMRYCTSDGVLDLKNKGPTPASGAEFIGDRKVCAWFNHAGRKTADDTILFGHWASLAGSTGCPRAIGLDTGCVWDGTLSMYELESRAWISCKCRAGKAVG
ncbi:MAG: diadenosine tetraphosphatase, partial [Halioglobus sp.]|nr:diadenosine tetraphosphatase [Halioglobus sp.]